MVTLLYSRTATSASDFDLKALLEDVSQSFTFTKNTKRFYTRLADVKIHRCYRDESLSMGRPNLGWCIDIIFKLRYANYILW